MRALAILLFLVPAMAIAQREQFEISGQVSGLPAGSTVFLTDANKPTDTLSKDLSKEGTFKLKGMIKEPNLYYINFGSQKKDLLFIGNDDVKISGSVDDIKKLVVKGSSSHEDFLLFQKTFNPLFQNYTQLNQKARSAGMSDSLSQKINDAFNTIQKELDNFISTHKSSFVSPFALVVTSQINEDPLVLERRFNQLDEKVKKGYFGSFLKNSIEDAKIGAVGTDAIDFTQNDVNGKPVQLSSLRGKYVLIDFWASWCGPCRMENPNVVSAYHKFKEKNFTVLGVSLDRSKEPWLKAIEEDQLAWTQVSDLKFWSNEVAVKYKIESIPQNFLVGPDGKIVAKNLRGPALQSKLCELLGCN